MPAILAIRLDVLCDRDCKKFALNLVAFYRNLLQTPGNTRFLEACPQTQREFWLDLHVTLLHYEEEQRHRILTVLAKHSLEDGYKLVQRLIDRQPPESQLTNGTNLIWRNSLKTAEFVTSCLLSTALTRFPLPSCLSSLAIQLVKFQKSSKAAVDVLMKMVDGNELITSSHMYFLCEALSNEVTHSHILFASFLTCIFFYSLETNSMLCVSSCTSEG